MAYLRKGQEVPTRGKGQKLSAKMEMFVSEYLIDLNGTAAVQRAGYKTRNPNKLASELLRHPLVKAAIDDRMAEKQERNELTEDYIIQKLIKIVEDTDKSSPTAALRGLELLGKTLGLFKERQEISGPDGEAIKMEQKVKENAADFTSKLASLVKRAGTDNVVEFPDGGREG